MAAESRFRLFWMRKTMRKVRTVVLVLMMSCQALEKWKMGPETAQPSERGLPVFAVSPVGQASCPRVSARFSRLVPVPQPGETSA
jgi:hypothetical protein